MSKRGIELNVETGDVIIDGLNGLRLGATELQQAALIVTSRRGEIKEAPLVGGEAGDMRGGEVDVMWSGRVRRMLGACGLDCHEVRVKSGGVEIVMN